MHNAVGQAQRYANLPDLKPDQTPDEAGQNMMTDEEMSDNQESSETPILEGFDDELGQVKNADEEREKVERKRLEQPPKTRRQSTIPQKTMQKAMQ